MRRALLAVAAIAAFTLAPPASWAKPKPKPAAASTTITKNDLRVCIGADGSTPDQQIAVCTKIINSGKVKHPFTADYYATRGAAYLAKTQPEKALADLNKAISIRQAPEFYFQRAAANMAMRQFDGAKADLAQVMKLKPDFAPAYLVRGLASYETGDYAEAAKYFDEALKRVPTYYQALFARGVMKKKLGDERGGERDIADARGMSTNVDKDMASFGLKP